MAIRPLVDSSAWIHGIRIAKTDNGATEREETRDKTSHKDWTEQMKMSLFYSLSVSLCCGSFSVCFLASGEVAKEVCRGSRCHRINALALHKSTKNTFSKQSLF